MALFINGTGQNSFAMNGVDIDNLYVDGVLVFTSIVEVLGLPRYELTEALVDASTVDDSANTLSDYNGLLTESDGTTPYEPTALQYPRNGLLELASGRIMDTQYVVEADGQFGIYGIYDADGSTTYKIWALEGGGLGPIANIYEGDQDTPLALTHTAVDIDEINDVDTWKVTDGRPAFIPDEDLELWDGTWADSGWYFASTTVPIDGEVCGDGNFAHTATYHYMTSKDAPIDVSGVNSVRVIRDYLGTGVTQREEVMYKDSTDGLCKYWGTLTALDEVIDSSNMDYIVFYIGIYEGTSAPALSVLKES